MSSSKVVLGAALTVVVVAATLGGCTDGGADRPATAGTDTAPTTTAAEAVSSTVPADMAAALKARLADEWQDPALAAAAVDGLGADQLAAFEAKVPLAAVATTPLLAYRAPTTPAADVDSLMVFAFGYRDGADGAVLPGPVNEALAGAVERFVASHPVPVYAQHEVADVLTQRGVPGVTAIEPEAGPDGKVVYLSTAGVAEQARRKAEQAGTPLGTVGVVCFADHEGRCLLTARAAGLDAAVPEGIDMPTSYDPESAQPWTRTRGDYLRTDLTARLAMG